MFDNNQNTSGDTTFNLSTGTIVSGTGTITSVGNGWYRCAIFPLKNFSTTATPRIYLDDGTSSTYTGNGFSGAFIWGAQLEVASFATSYIPTTTAAATRAQDTVLMTGSNFSSWHNPAEGVLYAEWRPYTLTPSVANGVFSLNNGADSNVVQIFGSLVSGRTTFEIYSNSTSYVNASVSSVLTTTNFAKIAASYETNNAIQATDGQLSSADTSVPLLSGINRADIATINGGNYVGNGHYKKVAYYPQAVTSAQLQALTS